MDQPPSSRTAPPPGPRRFPWLSLLAGGIALLALAGTATLRSGFIPASASAAVTKTAPKFHCPMHPSIVSDKPGKCSICGMDLVPIGEGAAPVSMKSGVSGLAVVSIAPQARQTMGLKLGTVEKRPLNREVRTSARIVADETRQWRVSTKIDGWIDHLFISYTGQEVQKGDPLLSIYSPALVSAQGEYLNALRAREKGSAALDPLVAAARKRLELWDISDEQLATLIRTGKVEKTLTLYAPATGVVLTRDVLAGQKIAPGDPLMVIADLSTVWGDADIYQSDLANVKVGMPLSMTLPYWPGKASEGKVIFVSPTLDPETRTLKARLEIPNPAQLLKPGMFGDARLFYPLGENLALPASAVMFGGQRTYAFRDNGDTHLVPTEIQIGARSGDFYELLGGLHEGDRVVVSANFLVDSESNLKAALEAMAGNSSEPQAIAAANYTTVLAAYLKIQEALAADDLEKAREAAHSIDTLPAARALAAAPDLEKARVQFKPLSSAVIAAAQQFGAPGNTPLSHQFCPMAHGEKGADWLQPKGPTHNPYFGKEMLECGEPKEEIAPRP
ncbi:MAG: efflux RND transporter periplasmic adaptor subunit [Chthoniobacteraceae bacterium]